MKGKFLAGASWRPLLCFLVALSFAAMGEAQQPAELQIDFSNPNLVPPHWVIKFHPDGSGRFDAEGGQPTDQQPSRIFVGELHRDIQLSPHFTEQAFLVARLRKFFNFPCESHMKVAFQGNKRLSYSGADGSGSCEYNFSKDKEIESLGNSLMAIEYTIVSGARLEKLLVHDRLGLDQELESLADAIHGGDAAEPGVIRDVLTRIAGDDQVMDRARKRARILLESDH